MDTSTSVLHMTGFPVPASWTFTTVKDDDAQFNLEAIIRCVRVSSPLADDGIAFDFFLLFRQIAI